MMNAGYMVMPPSDECQLVTGWKSVEMLGVNGEPCAHNNAQHLLLISEHGTTKIILNSANPWHSSHALM